MGKRFWRFSWRPGFLPGPPGYQEQAGQTKLAVLLKRSAEYCRRLDKAALDFVCLEEVTETSRHFTLHADLCLYDYQFIRKGGETKEVETEIKY